MRKLFIKQTRPLAIALLMLAHTVTVLASASLQSEAISNHPSLPDFDARYAVQKYGLKLATATYTLHRNENTYHIAQHTELYGVAALFRNDTVRASSHVTLYKGQPRLQDFTYIQTGKEKNRDEELHFSYPDNPPDTTLIKGVSRSQPINVKTQGAVWDILSFQIPLMMEARPDIKTYPYKAIINGELDQYTFNLVSTGSFQFADRDYQTLEVVRNDPVKNRQLHIWLAPELHNLPVIIENYRDGELHSRMQLEQVQFDHQPVMQDNLDEADFDE